MITPVVTLAKAIVTPANTIVTLAKARVQKPLASAAFATLNTRLRQHDDADLRANISVERDSFVFLPLPRRLRALGGQGLDPHLCRDDSLNRGTRSVPTPTKPWKDFLP